MADDTQELVDYFLQHHRRPVTPRRSHLDLRLGPTGKPLRSWAVPAEKLPDEGEKLLAVETKPHSYQYGSFSGTFGKGRDLSEVRLLQRGSTPVQRKNDGIFSFTLADNGKKRDFALVRIKGDKKYLLIGKKTPKHIEEGGMVKTVEVPMVVSDGKGVKKATIMAKIADNPQTRRRGLSKIANLPENEGMFFDVPGPFWMKDVNIPLDILFMSKKGEIVDIKTMKPENVCTFSPKLYTSGSEKAAYALETAAGWAKKHKITKGDCIEVQHEE